MKSKHFLNSCCKQCIPHLVIILFLIIGLTLQSCNNKSNRRRPSQATKSYKSKSGKQQLPKLEGDLSESSQLVSKDNSFSDDKNASSSSTRGKKTKRGKVASNQNQITTTTTSTNTNVGNKKSRKQTSEAEVIGSKISQSGLFHDTKRHRGDIHRKNILRREDVNNELDSQKQPKKKRIKQTKQESKGKKEVTITRRSNRMLSKNDKTVSSSINSSSGKSRRKASNTEKGQKLQLKKRRIVYKQPNNDEEEEEEENGQGDIRHSRQLKESSKRKRSRISRKFDEGDGHEEQEENENNDAGYPLVQGSDQELSYWGVPLTRSGSKKLRLDLDSAEENKLKDLRKEELEKEEAERLEIINQYNSPHKLSDLIRIANTNEEKEKQDEITEKEKGEEKKLTLEEISDAQYTLAQYRLGEYEVTQQGPQLVLLFNEAIKWYVAAASKGHLKAQQMLRKLRDRGAYSNIDNDAVEWYKQAVLAAFIPDCDRDREEYYEEYASYNKFNEDAKTRLRDYQQKIFELENKRDIFKDNSPTNRGPMRLSDLIVMDLNIDTVPVYIEWGGNYTSRLDARADAIFAPLFTASRSARYEDAVMTIDPSGKGKDETAYCVAKRYGNNYFILDVGGLAGGYNENEKDRIGNSPEVLKKLVLIAKKYKVNVIIVETNNDGSFDVLMQRELEKHGKKYLILRTHHQYKNKEQRIIDFLHPLAVEHRLIIDRNALKEDFESQPRNNLYYKFFYQLMGIIEVDSRNSLNYFDKGKLQHDDRVDVVADAIRYLKTKKETPEKVRESIEDDKKLALDGNIEKQLELGQRYKNGIGVEQDYKEACKWYTMAADSGNNPDSGNHIEAVFNLAQLYRYQHKMILEKEKKRTETARGDEVEKVKERESEKGKEKEKDNEERSEGKNKDNLLEQAINLYEQALKKDHPGAAYELGRLYYNNLIKVKEGDSTSIKKAISLFKRSADKDYPKAAYQLGKIFQKEANYSDAIGWYKKAAQQNHVKAQLKLANLYYEGEVVSRDFNKAKKYYKGPAHAGYPKAMLGLGNIYYNGEDRQKNYAKAFKWYQQAGEQRDEITFYNLGKMYEKAKSQKRENYQLAFQYYQMAADLKYKKAEFKLGEIYERGLVTEKDFKKAREWYEKACSNDCENKVTKKSIQASFNLAQLYERGDGGTKDDLIAFQYYEKAADKGHMCACYKLASMYRYGKGTNRDSKKAEEYDKRAELCSNYRN